MRTVAKVVEAGAQTGAHISRLRSSDGSERLRKKPVPHFDLPTALRALDTTALHLVPGHQGRKVSDKELFEIAVAVKESDSKPTISGFRVGAAAVTKSGRIVTGANVETSDRLCIGTCAECAAVFKLKGEELDTIVLASDSDGCIAPCGACCQTLTEHAPEDARVVMTSKSGDMKETTVGQLLGVPTTFLPAKDLGPYQAGIDRARAMEEKADNGGRDVPAHGAVVVDDHGGLHGGATRKGSGTMTLALQMAVDRFSIDGTEEPAYVVVVGEGGPRGVPEPSGRERQELVNLRPDIPVLLVDRDSGFTALTNPAELLPFAYSR